MFYGVYYYYEDNYYQADVQLAGFYENVSDAKKRIHEIIPNCQKNYGNSISNNQVVGWVNKYEFGNIPYDGLSASQPHNSINVID